MRTGPFSSIQSLSHVWLFATPWTAVCQASLSITNSLSLLKLMSIELVMPSNHLILCDPLLLLPSIFPSVRVLSNESVLYIRWPKYWSFKVCSNSCPLSRWYHPTTSFSVAPLFSCPQSFPASGSFQMSQLFASGGQVLEFQLQHQSFQWIFRTYLL